MLRAYSCSSSRCVCRCASACQKSSHEHPWGLHTLLSLVCLKFWGGQELFLCDAEYFWPSSVSVSKWTAALHLGKIYWYYYLFSSRDSQQRLKEDQNISQWKVSEQSLVCWSGTWRFLESDTETTYLNDFFFFNMNLSKHFGVLVPKWAPTWKSIPFFLV